MRIWNRIRNEPWAISETALTTIVDIAARNNESPEAVAAKLGRELQNTHKVRVRDGVAILSVVGPLFRYANLFTAISNAASYELLARDFTVAIEDPDIHAVVLDIDSPGGEVNGCSELADLVFGSRGKKPIVAYCSGDAASGAYWIASACDQVIVSATSSLGSIGVIAVLSRNDSDNSRVTIISSQSPHKILDPDDDDDLSRLQNRIDSLADVFIESVARYRGVTPDTVKSSFGGGDVFVGVDAVVAGLADNTGSLERVISELILSDSGDVSSVDSLKKETPMNIKKLQAKCPDLIKSILPDTSAQAKSSDSVRVGNHDLETIQDKYPDLVKSVLQDIRKTQSESSDDVVTNCQNIEKLQAECPELVRSIQKDAVAQERTRVSGILAAAVEYDQLLLGCKLAYGTDLSAEAVTDILSFVSVSPDSGLSVADNSGSDNNPDSVSASSSDSGLESVADDVSGFERLMGRMKNPEIEPDLCDSEASADAVCDRIVRYSRGL